MKKFSGEKGANLWPMAAICLAAFLWAFEGIVFIPLLFNLTPATIVFMVHFIGFIILNIFFFSEIKKIVKFDRWEVEALFLVAFLGGAFGTLAIVKALSLLQFHALSIVLLLQKLQPIFAIVLAMVLLKEKPGKNFLLFSSLAIIASYFLTFGFNLPDLGTNRTTLYAAILAFFAAFSFGASTVFGRMLAKKHSFVTITYFRYGFTSILMFGYLLLTPNLIRFSSITTNNWIVFFAITLTTGLGAMFMYYFGLRKTSATVSTICEMFFPVSAIILDYFVNGVILTPIQIISALIMLSSITMMVLENSKSN